VAVAVGTCASLTVILGVCSTPLAEAARAAAQSAMARPDPSHAVVAASAEPPAIGPLVH
jgi:hypothetical protein